MKIGIIGTRGIPNKYGGFEQFAMFFAEFLVAKGFDVTVYNSSNHPYKKTEWNGVKIKHIYDPEPKIGTIGQFVYDFLTIRNTRKQNFDIILQLGYTSSSVWGFMLPKKTRIITNMDGLEWKRTKYNKLVQSYLKIAEKWAVKQSNSLISDSLGIQNYLLKKYNSKSTFIPYGAEVFENFDEKYLAEFNLLPNKYNLIIARLEPENNIEVIIKGHLNNKENKLVIIGNYNTKFGKYLKEKYDQNVIFLGGIYDINILNNLRYYARYYFHGHSVGGTNPSLLEAMACNCLIVAHDNEFNKSVLEENAMYFKEAKDIEQILKSKDIQNKKSSFITKNMHKIKTMYSFETIHNQLLSLIKEND